MRVRKLMASDLAAYRALRLRSLLTDPNSFFLQFNLAKDYPDSFFLNELTENLEGNFGFYGAIDDGKLVGMVALKPISAGLAQIFTLYVTPECRGQGTGSTLLSYLILLGKEMKLKKLRLTVINGNTAIPMYEALGFKLSAKNLEALRNSNGVFDELVYQMELP